jgi:hypothetical protein
MSFAQLQFYELLLAARADAKVSDALCFITKANFSLDACVREKRAESLVFPEKRSFRLLSNSRCDKNRR